jgi:hypothetical protein
VCWLSPRFSGARLGEDSRRNVDLTVGPAKCGANVLTVHDCLVEWHAVKGEPGD